MRPPARPIQENHREVRALGAGRALLVDWLVFGQSGMERAFWEGDKDGQKHCVEEPFGGLETLLVGQFPEPREPIRAL